MMKLTVLEKVEKGYLVSFEVDGEDWGEKVVDHREMMSTIETRKKANIDIFFEEKVEWKNITLEEYDGEFDIVLNIWTFLEDDVDYRSKHLKTYKRRKNAVEYAEKMAKFYECYVDEI